jgi:hypothetical protein
MNKKYINAFFVLAFSGLILQFASLFTNQDGLFFLGLLIGYILLIISFGFYAKAKGRSFAWCLLGLLSILSFIILPFLKEVEKGSNNKQDKLSTDQSKINILEQLEKLAHLKEKGVLTEEEFIFQKKKLLSS